MLSIINQYVHQITAFEILLQETRSDLTKTKIKLVLMDRSILFLREIIIRDELFDYSYHWQSEQGKLMIRWDNAAHYPDIVTFPHHKHVGEEHNIQPSHKQTSGK